MTGRTSQLQIRVSPEQKAALKRLAAAAGQSVSAYVLGRALPREGDELLDALDRLRRGWDEQAALARLARLLPRLESQDLEASLGGTALAALRPVLQNCVAAMAEWAAAARGVEPPSWASAIAPLPRPHFRWSLESLKPYQARASPAAYKRRNLFDPGVPRVQVEPPPRRTDLDPLIAHLATLEAEVEFYFIGGGVLWQAFPAAARSARPGELLAFGADPVAAFLGARGLSRAWAAEAVQATSGRRVRGGSWIGLDRIVAFEPPPPYALAMKLACLTGPPSTGDLDDLRFLLRSMNYGSPGDVWSAVTTYVSDRYLPSHAKATLDLLA